MRSAFGKSTSDLVWKIRTVALIISVVLVFGSTSVFARGGGHGGGHGGSHSGGHGGHSGGHRGHHGGHAGSGLGGFTAGSIARGHFTNQNPCLPTDKISENCPELGEKQWKEIPAEKAGNRFESRFD